MGRKLSSLFKNVGYDNPNLRTEVPVETKPHMPWKKIYRMTIEATVGNMVSKGFIIQEEAEKLCKECKEVEEAENVLVAFNHVCSAWIKK